MYKTGFSTYVNMANQTERPNDFGSSFEGATTAAVLDGGNLHLRTKGCRSEEEEKCEKNLTGWYFGFIWTLTFLF